MRLFASGLLALMLASSVTLAEPERGKDDGRSGQRSSTGKRDKDDRDGKEGDKDDKDWNGRNGDGGVRADAEDDEDEAPAADAGKPLAVRRTPAQLAFRKETWERREKAIEGEVHKSSKRLTEDEREAIRQHWSLVSRLLRIRELAQEERNEPAVKRVDLALDRAEKICDGKLEKLEATAGGAK